MPSFVPLPVQLFYRVPRPRVSSYYVGTYFSKAIWKIIFSLILVQYLREQQGTCLDIHRTYSYILLFTMAVFVFVGKLFHVLSLSYFLNPLSLPQDTVSVARANQARTLTLSALFSRARATCAAPHAPRRASPAD
jgi:hypothetical protein